MPILYQDFIVEMFNFLTFFIFKNIFSRRNHVFSKHFCEFLSIIFTLRSQLSGYTLNKCFLFSLFLSKRVCPGELRSIRFCLLNMICSFLPILLNDSVVTGDKIVYKKVCLLGACILIGERGKQRISIYLSIYLCIPLMSDSDQCFRKKYIRQGVDSWTKYKW